MPKLMCTVKNFTPHVPEYVRWLSRDTDYNLAADFWRRLGSPLSMETWLEAIDEYRFRYAALVREDAALSIAGMIPYSATAWELGAVGTDGAFRRLGYARRVVSFVTAAILAEVPIATCTTDDANEAMIRTALGCGYTIALKDAAREYADRIGAYFHEVEAGIEGKKIVAQGET